MTCENISYNFDKSIKEPQLRKVSTLQDSLIMASIDKAFVVINP